MAAGTDSVPVPDPDPVPKPQPEPEPQSARWQEAGLYDPGAPDAPVRLALLEYLTERGATIAQMVEAHRLGSLPGVAGDLVINKHHDMVPVSEIASESGLALPRVLRALLAAGVPADPDTEVASDLVGLMAAFERGSELMGDEAILAFTRVLGRAAASIAEAAIALFFAEMGPGTVRAGEDELARARQAEAATTAFTLVPEVLARMVTDAFVRAEQRAELARTWPEQTPSAPGDPQGDRHSPVALALDHADRLPIPGPTEVVALGFVDLVGSTAWAQTLDLREQSLALTRFESAAWSSAVLAGGRVVKTIGDEVFFAAPTAPAACRIGLDVCRAAADDPVLPPARGAVGIGPVTPREGDYYGPLVNLLSRLVKAADPGDLVVTETAAAALPDDVFVLRPLPPAALRGIDQPVKAFTVERKGEDQDQPP
jgi:adenylate cyclase